MGWSGYRRRLRASNADGRPGSRCYRERVSDPNADAVVRQMREAIIDNDLKLMAAMNRRVELVARLRAYKTEQGMAFVDPEREQWMHTYLKGANKGPLSDEGLHLFYDQLLALTKAETTEP